MTKQDCLLQMLTSADARILLEQAGHKPVPEVADGRDTGRTSHRREGDELLLVFEDRTVLVSLS